MLALPTRFTTPPAAATAALLAQMPDTVWRGNQMGSHRAVTTPSGFRALDRELPNGGWPASVLIELLLSQPGIGELRLLAPVIAELTQAKKTVILMAPPHIPFAAALAELGIDLTHILLVEAEKPADRIWAIEQTLKSASFGALLCWLPQCRADHLRRLQLAAGGCEGLTFVLRPVNAQHESSPAPLRMVCRPAPSGQLSVEVIKRRGPVQSQPVILPLSVPAVLDQPFAERIRISQVTQVTQITHLPVAPTHAVDRTPFSATAARYRTALPA
ncbi:translesion DNA synthesis-associated protein ImuA [Actimicrobium antarcticum]|uniref:Protein ImuA n=1 Tax=Actimicrobium antarcticum TaxID=1051899 RepID=A0ABP7TQ69_9BURK